MEYMEYLQLKELATHGDFLSPISYYELNIEKGNFYLPMHWHEEMEITFIESGHGTYGLDLDEFPVTDKDILIIPPGILHASRFEGQQTIKNFSYVFHLNMLNSLLTDACAIKYFSPLMQGEIASPIVIHPDTPGYDKVADCFFKLHQVYKEKTAGYELAVKSYLLLLLFQLFHHNIFTQKGGKSKIAHTSELLKNVINYIHTNYAEHITVASLASLCDFSEYHFMRFFKKHVGMTCIDYINNYRLDIASAMLKESDSSVMEIALDTGFNNISYFNKVFKSKFNVTPSQYRKLLNEIDG